METTRGDTRSLGYRSYGALHENSSLYAAITDGIGSGTCTMITLEEHIIYQP